VKDRRSSLVEFLKENNIGTRVMYPPINKQKAYNFEGEYPVSNMIGKEGLWLPSSVQLTDGQIEYICNKIVTFYTEKLN
jgi:perosamine synthetase